MLRSRLLLVGTALVAGLAATACRTAPPPLDPTPQAPRFTYRLQTPTAAIGSTPTPAACTVTVAIHRLRTPAPGTSADLAASAIRSERGAPFRGASTLSADTLWAAGSELAPWLAAAPAREGAGDELPVGLGTAVVAAPLVTDVQWAAGAPTLRLLKTAAGVVVRILPAVAADTPRQEVAIADALPVDGNAALFVPDAPASQLGTVVLLQVGGEASEEAVAAALAAAPALTTVPEAPPVWQFAFDAVGEHNRRPALLAVARSSGLPR